MIDEIIKTRQYLDYLEEHYNNVQKAWKIIQDRCKGESFIYDDFIWGSIDREIKLHDKSKLSVEEFLPYRRKFFPTDQEKKDDDGLIDLDFQRAWRHHKRHNRHHWENWTKIHNQFMDVYLVQNICDWMAMGMKFGDTAKDYYEKNEKKIKLPKWAIDMMYRIFGLVYH